MVWTAAAIGGSALLGAYASDQASKRQAGAAGNASDAALAQYQQSRSDLSPYRQTGVQANKTLQRLLGIAPTSGVDWDAYLKANPDVAASAMYGGDPAQHYEDYGKKEGRALSYLDPSAVTGASDYGSLLKPFAGADLENEPGYQFAQSEGQKAIDRAASAAGRYDSGATLKALARYGNDYATTKFDDANSRDMANRNFTLGALTGQQGVGANASGVTAGLGANATSASNGYLTGGADASAAGLVGAGNAVSGGVGNYLQYQNNQSTLDYLKGLRNNGVSANGGWAGGTSPSNKR